MRLVGLFLLSLVFLPAPVMAKGPVYFQSCDGFGAPTGKGDGIVSGTYLFGLAKSSEDIRRGNINAFGEKGITACEQALADPLLKPEFFVRRAYLTQAKAFHEIGAFRFEDALKTLDAVDAMAPEFQPGLYERGIGIGNRLLRSFILIETDRDEEALAEISGIETERHYSVLLRSVSGLLRMRIDPGLENQIEILRNLAPLHPGSALEGFQLAMTTGRFEDAIVFGSGIAFDLPVSRGNWIVEGEQGYEYKVLLAQAEFDGSYAYALAAVDRVGESKQRVADAHRFLEEAMAPPPPPREGKKQKKSVLRDYESRLSFGKEGQNILERWEGLIDLRQDIDTLNSEDLFKRLATYPKGSVPIIIDLVAHLGGEPFAERRVATAELLKFFNEEREKRNALDEFKLAELLPHPETKENQVYFKKAGDGYFLSDNGFSRKNMGSEDDWTIRFAHSLATGPTVEEFAFLASAMEAKERGYDAILIQSRRLLERTTTLTGIWGGSYGSQNSGREAQLRVRFVHSTDLPSDLDGAGWRLLSADDVIAALSDLPTK